MPSIRQLFQAVVIATGISVAATLPANAGITFQTGNNPQPDEKNVFFTDGDTGFSIFGHTNPATVSVLFSSVEALATQANGQARVGAQDGLLNNLTITVPGGYYKDLIMNPKDGTGTATVSVLVDGNPNPFVFSYSLANGNNFLTLFADGTDKIVSTTITAGDGFEDLRQPRISGAALFERNPNPPAVPEPCSMALLATGALPLIGRLRRRRQPA